VVLSLFQDKESSKRCRGTGLKKWKTLLKETQIKFEGLLNIRAGCFD
jgi:hypothetical protein